MRHLRPVGKPAPPQAAQAGLVQGRDDRLDRALAGHAGPQEPIPAVLCIRLIVSDGGRGRAGRGPPADSVLHLVRGGLSDGILADNDCRGGLTAAHARHALDPDAPAEAAGQSRQQRRRAGQLTTDRIAHPDGQGRRRGLVLFDHIKMVVKAGHLVDLNRGQPHLRGQGNEMGRRQVAVVVLNGMQVLNQQIAPAGCAAEQALDLGQSLGVGRPAPGSGAPAPGASAAAVLFHAGARHVELSRHYTHLGPGQQGCWERLKNRL